LIVRRTIDLSLYLVVGADVTARRPVLDVVREAVAGGVTAVQLREKTAATRSFIDEARALVALLRPLGIALIINDRVDVALACGADGVHVGQDDMRVDDVRRLIGNDGIVGLSVTNLAEAGVVDIARVDYVGVGPVFSTATKRDAAVPLGLAGTADVCRAVALPAVAIGGIEAANAQAVFATGVQGIAVVSAICAARDPREAARRLVRGRGSCAP
jgi:thiamine-phosphate pyrophosphorylase